MSSWRRGRRSPAATWSTIRSITEAQTGQSQSPSYPKLPLHQVGACDHLRDGMFHLQPRVHLHEVEVVLGIHDELHRTCTGTRTAADAVARRSLATFGPVRLGASHLPRRSWQPWLLSLLLLRVSSELQDQFQAKKINKKSKNWLKSSSNVQPKASGL